MGLKKSIKNGAKKLVNSLPDDKQAAIRKARDAGKKALEDGKVLGKELSDDAKTAGEQIKKQGQKDIAKGSKEAFDILDGADEDTKKFVGKFIQQNKDLDSVDGVYQTVLPYHLTAGASIGLFSATQGVKGVRNAYAMQRELAGGENRGLRKLSSMTDSVLTDDPDANMVTSPLIRAMNNTSTPKAAKRSKEIEKNMVGNGFGSHRIQGNLVFALHNLR